MPIRAASLSASILGIGLTTSTLKDRVISTLWPDVARYFVIEEVRDFALVYEVTKDCVIGFSNHFVCALTLVE